MRYKEKLAVVGSDFMGHDDDDDDLQIFSV